MFLENSWFRCFERKFSGEYPVTLMRGSPKITNFQNLFSGGGSKLKGLAEDLSARLELPVEVLDPFRQIKVDTRKFDPDYLSEIMPEMAVAVGLAVRGVELR